MDFAGYRDTQLLNLGWTGRPDFPPSAELLSWIPDTSPGQVALEIGCCDGKSTALLEAKGYQTLGIDLFPELIAKAPAGPCYLVGDMHTLPLRTGAVDIVLADNILEHSWHVETAMREIMRVLKRPGDLFAMIPLWAKALSAAHLWEVGTIEQLLQHLLGGLDSTGHVMKLMPRYVPPEQQILLWLSWN